MTSPVCFSLCLSYLALLTGCTTPTTPSSAKSVSPKTLPAVDQTTSPSTSPPRNGATALGPSEWHGYTRIDFVLDARAPFVVQPKNPAPGRSWIWRPESTNTEP